MLNALPVYNNLLDDRGEIMSMLYLAVEKDLTIHERESTFWLSHGVASIRVSSMIEAIELSCKMEFLYIGINASNIDYLPSLKLFREVTNDPIFISTDSYTMQEQTKAHRLGADLFGQISDTPSENYEAVMAKIENLAWRINNPKPFVNLVTYKNILLSEPYRLALVNDVEVNLTRIEFDLLYILASNRGRVFTFEQLYHQVWGNEFDKPVVKVIKNVVARLHKKIVDNDNDSEARIIENKWGVGYKCPI